MDTKQRQKKITKKDKVCFKCGDVGHLAKLCPTSAPPTTVTEDQSRNEDSSSSLIYTPPHKIKFDLVTDINAFAARFRAFKHQSRKQPQLQATLYKPMLTELFAFLRWKYGNSKLLLVHPKDIRLAFSTHLGGSGGDDDDTFIFADTSAMTGYITFSTHTLETKLRDDTESGYKLERAYATKVCKGKEDYMVWLVIHEFTHLFVGCNHDRHDEEFFEEVMRLVVDNNFLFLDG